MAVTVVELQGRTAIRQLDVVTVTPASLVTSVTDAVNATNAIHDAVIRNHSIGLYFGVYECVMSPLDNNTVDSGKHSSYSWSVLVGIDLLLVVEGWRS